MKRYRTYTAKKYKVARKIIFFAVIAIIIFGVTVLFGNHLQDKLDHADTQEPLELDTTKPEKEKDEAENQESVSHDKALGGVAAGYLDLSDLTEGNDAAGRVAELKELGYNAVCFVVTDGEGKLTYASPSVIESSRLPADRSLVPFEALEAAVKAAKSSSMRLSCVIVASDSLTDELVVKELALLGFEEIIIRGFEEYTQLSNDYVSEIKAYVDRIRNASQGKAAISLSFTAELYKAPQNAPYIEKVYAICEFLSIDMTSFSSDEAGDAAHELQGSFTAYLLRPILDGSHKEEMSEVDETLKGAGVSARQYISSPENKEAQNTQEE